MRAIAFAPSGRHAVSAAASERSVAVWNTSGSKKAKKLGGVAVAALEIDDPAVAVCTCAAAGADADGSFYAAAVTEAGEAFVWLCAPEGEAAVVAALAARVRVRAGGGKAGGGGDAILAANLEAASEGGLLAAGCAAVCISGARLWACAACLLVMGRPCPRAVLFSLLRSHPYP